MANSQTIQSAENFKRVVDALPNDLAKNTVLTAGSIEVSEVLKKDYSEAKIAQILSDRANYNLVEQEAAAARQEAPQDEKQAGQGQQANQTAGSAGAAIVGAPIGIYSYFFNNPDKYTHEQLKKNADKYAQREARAEVKKAEKDAKKAKKKLTNEEREALFKKAHESAQRDYHDQYVLYHDKRARQLAADPAGNNPYLKRALFYKDTRAAMEKAAEAAKKDRPLKLTGVRSLPQEVRTQIPKTSIIKTVAMQPSTAKLGPIKTPSNILPKSHTPTAPHTGKGIPNPISKLLPKNPLSLLRRFLLPISITSTLIGVVLFTAVITFFFFDVGSVVGGTGSDQAPIDIYNPPAFSGNVDDYFTFINKTGKNQDSLIVELKNYLKIALAFPKYIKLLNVDRYGKITITLDPEATGYHGGWAVTSNDTRGGVMGRIDLYGDYISARNETQKLYLLHETAHTIDFRNTLSATFYPIGKKDGSACYNSLGFIRTYPTSMESEGNKYWESFADSFINTLFCKPGEKCGPNGKGADAIQNWPTTCVNTYNWMADNILGAGDQSSTNNTSSSSNTCGGYYSSTFSLNTNYSIFKHASDPNFGDPQCNLPGSAAGRDAFYVELKRILNGSITKSKSGEVIPDWMLFKIVINHEDGTYNPNRFNPNSSSGHGAYGLFQMNPEGTYHARQYDVGDVNWRLQIYNAAMLNTWGCKWRYWSSAYHFTAEVSGFGYNTRADCLPASTIQPVK